MSCPAVAARQAPPVPGAHAVARRYEARRSRATRTTFDAGDRDATPAGRAA
jgi:coproporphyrinogen III oxidase